MPLCLPSQARAFPSIALVLSISITSCSPANTPAAPHATIVDVVTVQPGSGQTSTLEGTLRARRDTALGFKTAGRVAFVAVQIGDRVHKGQVLARLTGDDVAAQTRQAGADLAAASATAGQTQETADSAKGLDTIGALSGNEIRSRTLTAAAAAARRDAARAALDLSRALLSDTVLVAPEDGIVIDRLAEPGMIVQAGATVIRLAAGEPEVEVKLPETMRLANASNATIAFPSQPAVVVHARLRRLDPAADDTLRLRAARFSLLDPVVGIPFNSSASVSVPLGQPGTGIRIPLASVSGRAGRGQVWLVSGHTIHRQWVAILDIRGEDAIVTGLTEGQQIVAHGGDTLTEGQTVMIAGAEGSPL